MRTILLLTLCSFSLFANPTGLEIKDGNASYARGNECVIQASDGAVLHWQSFSIDPNETVTFVQPSDSAWALNKVVGKEASNILGTLSANGQLVLLNPHGILFGQGATVDVGGIIASTLGEGPIVNKGAIHARSGDIILMGKTVESHGTLSVMGKVSAHGENNPYALAIQFKKPADATTLSEKNGRILLLSEEKTTVSETGQLIGKEVALISKGRTTFLGHATIEEGFFEISGRKGFLNHGTTDRKGGLLVYDPEADLTISTIAPYNYSFKEGRPESDYANISIKRLIEEIEKGPVTITTAFQGESEATGSIHLKGDVAHTYNSPYPLIFNCSGAGGIAINGKLKNEGSGPIILKGHAVDVKGTVSGKEIETIGFLTCSGELHGGAVKILSELGGIVSGKISAAYGPLFWYGGGHLVVDGGELGTMGQDALTIQGLEALTLENSARLFTFQSNLTISDLRGILSLDRSSIYSNGPLSISGSMGGLSLVESRVEATNQININLGRHFHSHSSTLFAHLPLSMTIGSDIMLSGNGEIRGTSGISLSSKGCLALADQSIIKGKGLSLVVGESTSLFTRSQIDGMGGSLSLTTGNRLTIDGKNASIQGGQITIHAGETLTLENYGKIASQQGLASITAGAGLHLHSQASISASGGNLELFVPGGNLSLSGQSALHSNSHGMALYIGQSLLMDHFSQIKRVKEKGTTIVLDQRDLGGGLVMGKNTSILTGNSPLHIYSSSPRNNAIQGTLNGHRYKNSILYYLNTTQDKWNTSFASTLPLTLSDAPFTFFHKEDGLIQTTAGPVDQTTFLRQVVDFIGPYTAELFRDLHPYDQYTSESIRFTDNHEPYFIRRRAEK